MGEISYTASMSEVKDYPSALQQQIERDIVSKLLHCGEKYSIEALGKHYNSKLTNMVLILPSLIRKGLITQVDEFIVRINGLPKANIESVFQYAEKSNLKPRTVVRAVTIAPADVFLAEKLNTAVGDLLYQQVRTRLVDEHVLANQNNFIPFGICPGLEEVDLSKKSFQVTLEQQFHAVITKIEETYELGNPTRDDTTVLDVAETDQLLIVQRISYSSSGMPLVFADIHVNPTQFHYVESLWPKAVDLVNSVS